MLVRAGAIILCLFAGCAFGGAQAADSACSVAGFESQPAATADACTAILNKPGLSDAERAALLKIRARSLHITGHLDEAIRDYDAALLLEPNDPELHLRRGWTAYNKADFKTVFEQAREAIKLKPDYADAYDLIGATLARPDVGRQLEAIALYQKAVQLNPGDPLFHIHLMEVYECCGQPENALHEAEAVLHLPVALITNPNSVERYQVKTSYRVLASLERARNLAILGRLDEAKRAYDLAVHDDPGTLTYAGRAAFLLEMAQAPLDKVQADLDKSLAADTNNWFSRGLQGRVYFYRKDYAAAEREFAGALAINAFSGEMHWQHAMTLRLEGRADAAAAEAVTAFKVDPDFMLTKIPALEKFGFASAIGDASDPRPALYDAARACMLDEQCW